MSKNSVTKFIRDHKFEAPASNFFDKNGTNRLKTYLGRVSKGQSKVFTAPFAKGQSMSKVMQEWLAVLESIRDKWPSLWDFENDLANKVGPMSIQKPLDERFEDIAHYYEDILLPQEPILQQAIDAVCNEWASLRGLALRSQRDTVDLMKKSTSSGSPYFTKRRNVVQETIPTVTESWNGKRPGISATLGKQRDEYNLAAVLGWRGQEGGPKEDDVKQRVIWMFPFSLNVCELQVYQPLIEAAQRELLVPAWVSNEQVDKAITRLFDSKDRDQLVVCTDFSKFDQHFNPVMQDAAKQILRKLLVDTKVSNKWLVDIFPSKYCIPLVYSVHSEFGRSFINAFEGYHGMASGSGGTNCDETIVHRALQHEVALLKGKTLNPNSQCLGDDGILSYPGITVEDVVEAYESHGQECNVSKQYASSQDCVYLRRWHHQNYRVGNTCVGVYSTCRALGRLRYLERYMDPDIWSPEMVALRQLSILENCKWHPLRNEFVAFCMSRDKYRLGIDIPGFLDNIVQLSKEATDYMPDFLGYTKTLQGFEPSGIKDWWIVQYLKSVR